ncbi:hypothetical protein [Aeromonas veronii]|uniref:hypothetical protein n=1 Tax=Aeromonas veronii TaxID=654 RepID=UPI003D1C080D
MGIFVLWLIMALVIGFIASTKNRSSFNWFLLAVFFSPVLAGLGLMLMGSLESEEEVKEKKNQQKSDQDQYQFVKSEFLELYMNNPEFESKTHIKALYDRVATETEPDIKQIETLKTAIQFMR